MGRLSLSASPRRGKQCRKVAQRSGVQHEQSSPSASASARAFDQTATPAGVANLVAEPRCWNWLTGWPQKPLSERACGFESHPGHSALRSHECVELGHALALGNRDRVRLRVSELDSEVDAGLDEQPSDVRRFVAEEVPGIGVPLRSAREAVRDLVGGTTPIGVDQPPQKSLGIQVEHDATLPRLEPDASEMFPTRRVLGKEARPMLRVRVQLGTTDAGNHADRIARHGRVHRSLTFSPDLRIGIARLIRSLNTFLGAAPIVPARRTRGPRCHPRHRRNHRMGAAPVAAPAHWRGQHCFSACVQPNRTCDLETPVRLAISALAKPFSHDSKTRRTSASLRMHRSWRTYVRRSRMTNNSQSNWKCRPPPSL